MKISPHHFSCSLIDEVKYICLLFAPLFLSVNLCPLLLLGDFFFLLFYNNSLHIKDNPLPHLVNTVPVFSCLLILLKVFMMSRCWQGKPLFFIFGLWGPSQEHTNFKKSCSGGKEAAFGMAIGRKRKTITWPSFIITQLPERGQMHSYPVKSGEEGTADPTALKYFLLALKVGYNGSEMSVTPNLHLIQAYR